MPRNQNLDLIAKDPQERGIDRIMARAILANMASTPYLDPTHPNHGNTVQVVQETFEALFDGAHGFGHATEAESPPQSGAIGA